MVLWLTFLSLLAKNYSYGLPGKITELPFFVFVLYLLWKLVTQQYNPFKKRFDYKTILFLVLITGWEVIQLLINYLRFGSTSQDTGPLSSLFIFAVLILSIGISYFVVDATVIDRKTIRKFILGTSVAFVVYLGFVLLPQLLVTLKIGNNDYVNFIAGLFEKRQLGRDWYQKGSYAATMLRINGLETEAANNAAILGILFIPWLLSSIKHHYNLFTDKFSSVKEVSWGNLISYLLLGISLITLLFAKTTTGIVVIVLTVLIMLWFGNSLQKFYYSIIVLLALGLVAIAYFNVPIVNDLLDDFLFAKGNTSNRLGGTIGLFITWLQHPFFGTGFGYIGHYLIENVPAETATNWEYINNFTQNYSVLSLWGGWLAQFGLIIVVPIIYKIREMVVNLKPTKKSGKLIDVVYDAMIYSMIIFAVLALFTFHWDEYYIFIPLFFFAKVAKLNSTGKINA